MPTPNDQPASPRKARVFIALGITLVVIVFIVLHLTGAMGSGSH